MFKNLFGNNKNNDAQDIEITIPIQSPTQGHTVQLAQADDIPSQDEYDLEVELEKSDKRATFIGNAFLVILALTTFSFGYSAVYIGADLSALTWLEWLGVQAARCASGLILTLLLDGMRYMWEHEEVSTNRVDTQQNIAWAMKWINFILSLFASLVNLPELINLLGANFPSIVSDTMSLMVLGLMLSVAINGLAYYLSKSSSPLQQRKRSLSSNKSKITQMGINQFNRAQRVATTRANAQMNGMINPLANIIADSAITDQLSTYGFRLDQLAPPNQPAIPPTAVSTADHPPATQYATQMLQPGSDRIDFDDEEEARDHAQALADVTGISVAFLINGTIIDVRHPTPRPKPQYEPVSMHAASEATAPSKNGYHPASEEDTPL